MSTASNKEIVRRYQDGVWNVRDINALEELIAPETQFLGSGGVNWRDDVRAHQTAYPDVRMTIHEMVAEGDSVVCRWTLRGKHTYEVATPYGPAAPTGNEMATNGISIFHLRNGKIVGEDMAVGRLEWLQQLGKIPLP